MVPYSSAFALCLQAEADALKHGGTPLRPPACWR